MKIPDIHVIDTINQVRVDCVTLGLFCAEPGQVKSTSPLVGRLRGCIEDARCEELRQRAVALLGILIEITAELRKR